MFIVLGHMSRVVAHVVSKSPKATQNEQLTGMRWHPRGNSGYHTHKKEREIFARHKKKS